MIWNNSRRNCLLLHGMPESDEDSNEVVISVCNGKLELNVSADDIDRSHRLGSARHSNDDNNTIPRPIIAKFRRYETRRRVFSAKRKLKGSKVVVTENLTKRRSELYTKVRALSNVQCLLGRLTGESCAYWTTEEKKQFYTSVTFLLYPACKTLIVNTYQDDHCIIKWLLRIIQILTQACIITLCSLI